MEHNTFLVNNQPIVKIEVDYSPYLELKKRLIAAFLLFTFV